MIIGITGGIASGKSTTCKILNEIIENSILLLTDDIAKEQQKIGEISYLKIVEYFGNEILNDDKTINSSKLGQIVFNDKDKLLLLNSITHPNVINYVKEVIENNKDKTILIESALLFDCELKDLCDKTIFVSTNLEKRIQWMRENRNYSDEKIQSILSKQKNDEKLADTIIENNGSLEELREKCMMILK